MLIIVFFVSLPSADRDVESFTKQWDTMSHSQPPGLLTLLQSHRFPSTEFSYSASKAVMILLQPWLQMSSPESAEALQAEMTHLLEVSILSVALMCGLFCCCFLIVQFGWFGFLADIFCETQIRP